MDTDTERVVLLAQIALEGVTLSPEVQDACSTATLRAILDVAVRRSARGLEPMQYVARTTGLKPRVYPAYGALPCP